MNNEYKTIPFADVKQREDGSLVRTADCEPELDFVTWWELNGEHNVEWTDTWVTDMCKAAWDAARAK